MCYIIFTLLVRPSEPCYKNTFTTEVCDIIKTGNDDFCSTDQTLLNQCCEYCGFPTVAPAGKLIYDSY